MHNIYYFQILGLLSCCDDLCFYHHLSFYITSMTTGSPQGFIRIFHCPPVESAATLSDRVSMEALRESALMKCTLWRYFLLQLQYLHSHSDLKSCAIAFYPAVHIELSLWEWNFIFTMYISYRLHLYQNVCHFPRAKTSREKQEVKTALNSSLIATVLTVMHWTVCGHTVATTV